MEHAQRECKVQAAIGDRHRVHARALKLALRQFRQSATRNLQGRGTRVDADELGNARCDELRPAPRPATDVGTHRIDWHKMPRKTGKVPFIQRPQFIAVQGRLIEARPLVAEARDRGRIEIARGHVRFGFHVVLSLARARRVKP